MKPSPASLRGATALLLALILSLAVTQAADEAALKAEIEAVRKATTVQYKDRLPDNFEDYVRDTGRRNHYQREFNTAMTSGNAAALAVVLKEFPEFARAEFLNGVLVQGKRALHYAVERGHREVVELLLAQKVDADVSRLPMPFDLPSTQGYAERRDTPLHVAVRESRPDLARLLLDAGANIETVDTRGESPLFIGVRLLGAAGGYSYGSLPIGSEARPRQEELIALLLQRGARVLSTDRNYSWQQPLTAVLQSRNEVLLDLLLTNTIHLAASNSVGDTLVHLAVTQGRTNALRALLEKRAPFGVVNASGFTPLRRAAWLPVVAQLLSPITQSGGYTVTDPGSRAGFQRQHSANFLLAAGAEADPHSLAGLGRTNELAALLRREPAQASARDPQDRSPLHYAVNAGAGEVLRMLVQAGAELEVRDKSGQTPLLQAIANRRFNEVTHLIAAGAKVMATNATGQTALHLAVGVGDTNLFAALVAAGADLNARDAAGKAPVELAAVSQRFDLVQWLEARGAATAPRAERRMTTTLHQAVAQGNQPQFLKLLATGADVNARNEQGLTPLAIAVAAGRPDIVLTLLTNGANVNLPDTNGVTPLHARFLSAFDVGPELLAKPSLFARLIQPSLAKSRSPRQATLPPELRSGAVASEPLATNVLLQLIQHGADPRLADIKGNTMLHHLQPFARGQSPQLVQQAVARLRLLADHGLATDTRSTAGFSPLHLTAARADLIHTFALLEAGANVNAMDAQGRTALHHALTPQASAVDWQRGAEISRERARTLALLLDNGADLRRLDTNDATALHLLPRLDEGLLTAVLAVLRTNRYFAAVLNQQDKTGKTPVLHAIEQLRVKPVAPLAKLLTTLFDSLDSLPPIVEQGGTTLLHEAAGISVVGHPVLGAQRPDLVATESIARLTAKILAAAPNVDLRNAKGETPLHVATRHQNAAFANALLSRSANPNAQDYQGDTPLHLALRSLDPINQSNPMVPLLVSNKCDLARRNLAGETPLQLEATRKFLATPMFLPSGVSQGFFQAVRLGDLRSVNTYLTLDPRMATLTGPSFQASALRQAALAGHKEIADRLRNAGATDPVSAAVLGWTNSLAVFVSDKPRLAETNFNVGMPLLHLAASRGQLASVRVLLTEAVSPRLEDASCRTALYHATTNGNAELVAWLTARGAQCSLFDAIALADLEQLEALLAAEPARANETNRLFVSALLFATDLGNLPIVRRLLAHGANPNQPVAPAPGFFFGKFYLGTVPLHLAAWSNRLDLAEAFVAAKANLSVTNDRGYTTLHFAVARGHREMTTWLLDRGADPNVQIALTIPSAAGFPAYSHQMNQGWTPLHLAVRYGHTALIELLVARGAKLEATDARGRTPADLTEPGSRLMTIPWPPAPYRGLAPGMPVQLPFHEPDRAMVAIETLKKLGAVMPPTRGAIFSNPRPPPGFPSQPGFPVPPPRSAPTPKQ